MSIKAIAKLYQNLSTKWVEGLQYGDIPDDPAHPLNIKFERVLKKLGDKMLGKPIKRGFK